MRQDSEEPALNDSQLHICLLKTAWIFSLDRDGRLIRVYSAFLTKSQGGTFYFAIQLVEKKEEK